MSNHLSLLSAALLAAGMGSGTALAQTAERGCIELKTVAETEVTYVDERGNDATRFDSGREGSARRRGGLDGGRQQCLHDARRRCRDHESHTRTHALRPELGLRAGREHRVLARRLELRRARSAAVSPRPTARGARRGPTSIRTFVGCCRNRWAPANRGSCVIAPPFSSHRSPIRGTAPTDRGRHVISSKEQ